MVNYRDQYSFLNISLDGKSIGKVARTKFLGCMLDDRLQVTAHTEELRNKLSRATFLCKNVVESAGPGIAKLVYNAYFHSHLNYCAEFWCMTTKTHFKKLYVQQSRAILVVTNAATTNEAFSSLKVLPLAEALTYGVCKFPHERITNQGPEVLKLSSLGTNRSTRAGGTRLIQIERRNTHIGSESYYARIANIWNSLPQGIRLIDSEVQFKKKLLLLANDVSGRRKFF
ncbi:uncharacterized protein LOC108864285 [Galendromus occidentalis]|uniref:Uncharacterized protein LOC108864285 n=1 Tax=Galendromus occidentalis TaxID=34638 RepID=A0AAJ7L5J5_9ACAR|nr:uncharacterized protein LOC108864285 [Galendromus occidentalis]